MPRLIDLARRMIAIDSVTSRGTRDLAAFCANEVLARTDLVVSLWEGEDPSQVNLVATRALGTRPPILLNSHLDTVPPGDPELWTECDGNPFAATVSGDRLYGLGAADAKLDWLCKALAFERLRDRPFSRGVIFAATFGEESGLRGARALLPRLPERPVAAWAGEPTELAVVTRHKGLLVVTVAAQSNDPEQRAPTVCCTVHGRAAHSSMPHLGDNAILKALRLSRTHGLRIAALYGGDAANKVPARCELHIRDASPSDGRIRSALGPDCCEASAKPLAEDLHELLLALVLEAEQIAAETALVDPSFSPPALSWNLGKVEAEGGSLRATLDFRYLPGDGADRILSRLEGFLARERRERRIEASLAIERNNPPLATPSDSLPVAWSLAALAEAGLSTELHTKAGCTEAGLYAAAGIPSVVFGPGQAAGNIHAPNEWVAISDLERAVEFYTILFEKVCTS